MATKKNMTEEKLRKAKADDAVVYKVMVALVLLCGAIFGLNRLRAYYQTIGGFSALYDLTLWVCLGALVLSVAAAVVLAVLRNNRIVRAVCPWLLAVFLMIAFTAFTMRRSWVSNFSLLYFVCGAALVQYIIFQLYRWEFFLVSLSTVMTGFGFYTFRNGVSFNGRTILILAAIAIVLLGTALAAFLAARGKGRLVLGKLQYAMFPSKFNPILIYAADVLWLCCMIAALLLGGLFSYYCMFAAIAVEFIAAVYYTFQLN